MNSARHYACPAFIWRPLPAWDPHAIRSQFEIEVFRFLRRKDLLSRGRATVRIDPHGSPTREATELDVIDFIARLAVQVPGPHERLVQYQGDLLHSK